MKECRNKREIELRLNELDRMESQIIFSADFLSSEDRRRLGEINTEKAKLKLKLDKLKRESGTMQK